MCGLTVAYSVGAAELRKKRSNMTTKLCRPRARAVRTKCPHHVSAPCVRLEKSKRLRACFLHVLLAFGENAVERIVAYALPEIFKI